MWCPRGVGKRSHGQLACTNTRPRVAAVCDRRSHEDTHKVNADNELSLTPAVALDLGGVPGIRGDGHVALGLWRRLRVARVAGVAWRSGSAHDRRRVSGDGRAGVDGGGTTNHLGGRSACLTWVR
jgi:hypothetical protein